MTIIVLLFLLQRLGSGAVGRVFGPVMLVWFATIAVLGIRGITMHPEVLKALSPSYAFELLFQSGSTGFFVLTSVVLAFTGVEALYADMGHFGRPAITRAWLLLVFPACILSYLGQGGLILDDPSAISAPFFRLMPHGGLIPLVILATVATVIASQAVISGAFSIAHQASQLGYLPRLRVVHTSKSAYGQVYVPVINRLLLVGVLALVLAFQSSANLAFAYGTAVTGTILVTSVLFFFIVRHRWHRPLWLTLAGAAFFLSIELLFFASNLTKIAHGAWLPLTIALVLFFVMVTWYRGRELVTTERFRVEGPLRKFVDEIRRTEPPVDRVPGTGVFLNRGKETAPLSMRACVDHLHSLPENAIILSLETLPVPRIRPKDRLEIDDLGYQDDRLTFVRAKHGYAEEYDVPKIVRQIAKAGVECPVDARHASFFLSRVELRPTRSARDEPLAQARLPGHRRCSPPSRPTTSSCRASGRLRWAPRSSSDAERGQAQARLSPLRRDPGARLEPLSALRPALAPQPDHAARSQDLSRLAAQQHVDQRRPRRSAGRPRTTCRGSWRRTARRGRPRRRRRRARWQPCRARSGTLDSAAAR